MTRLNPSFILALSLLAMGACNATAPPTDTTIEGDVAVDASDIAIDLASEPDTVEDVVLDSGVEEPPVKGETEWLSWDDGVPAATVNYSETPDGAVEQVRFDGEEPFRIWSIQAAFAVPEAGTARLFIWDDFGGNFFNLNLAKPLATFEREVTPEDDGQWLTFELAEPLTFDPGHMFYAGTVLEGEHAIQLRMDAEAHHAHSDGKGTASSMVWLSKKAPDENGFPALAILNGDFMVRAEIEKIHIVPEEARDFRQLTAEEVGELSFGRASIGDVDGDGDLDVMAAGPQLFLNDGTGFFTNVSADWLGVIAGHNSGVLGDFDNDGDPDYFATGHQGGERLLRNDGDHFTDVTAESGIDDSMFFNCNGDEGVQALPTEAAATLDYNGDGWLDIYQANFICWDAPAAAGPDILWRNNGDGTFTNVTSQTGVSKGQTPGKAGRGVATADANGDGIVDIMVANYRLHKNLYFESQGDGLYKGRGYDTGLEGNGATTGYYGHTIGAAFGDVDHDGDLDLFHANLAHPRFIDFSDKATLWINDGQVESGWTDETEAAQIRYLETPSNPNFLDFDNDGDLDLFYTCVYPDRTSQLYRNDGHPLWTEVTYSSGSAVFGGWGSMVGDMDGDGDLDLLAGGAIYRNRNIRGFGSIRVDVEGLGAGMTNRDGVGVRVEATIGGRLVMRERVGGHGTGVQDAPTLHLGLGTDESADLIVRFPTSGVVIEVDAVPAGAHIRVVEDGTIIGLD